MRNFRYLQLDVFPATPAGGNPLGVVVDARGLSGAEMQRIAAWTNLVETTFLLPPEHPDASYCLRIFTPSNEIPFAGHPTIGSAHAALLTGFARAREGLLVWRKLVEYLTGCRELRATAKCEVTRGFERFGNYALPPIVRALSAKVGSSTNKPQQQALSQIGCAGSALQ